MPFVCKFQLNNGAVKETDEIVFEHFIEDAFGKFHTTNQKIAKISINGQSGFITSTCPCFISSKCKIVSGEKINANTIIGYFSANGEDIPYDRPYATIII